MSLDSAIDYLLSKTHAPVKLSAQSKAIADWSLPSRDSRHPFIRDAEPHECELYAINEDDFVSERRRATKRVKSMADGQPRDIDRLLSAATNLNKVCNVPDIQEIIERFRQEQDTRQTDLEYMIATYNENKIEIERLTKAAKSRGAQSDQMDVDDQTPKSGLSKEGKLGLRLNNELKELEAQLDRKKKALKQSQEALRDQEEAAASAQAQKSVATPARPSPPPPSATDPSGSFSNLQISLQENLGGATTGYMDMLSTARRELLRAALSDQENTDRKVMAKVVQLLDAEDGHRIPLEALKQSANQYATSLSLGDSAGTQAIYKLNAYKLVIIDRSQDDSFVQLA